MDDLRIASLDLHPLDLELVDTFEIASGGIEVARNLAVRVALEGGAHGWGEIAPFAPFTESREECVEAAENLRSMLVGSPARRLEQISRAMAQWHPDRPATRAGLEMAMLDAMCRARGTPLWVHLGAGARGPLETDVTIPILPLDRTLELARGWVHRGFRVLKLKVGKDAAGDLDKVEAIARAHPHVGFVLDANAGFTADEAIRFLREAERVAPNVVLFEQPCAREDLEGMARVRASTSVPVAADESAASPDDVREVIRAGAADVVNLKVMKAGLLATLEMARVATAAGLRLMIGGMVESRLGMSCSLGIALGLGTIDHCDLDTPLLIRDDPVEGGYAYDGPWMSRWEAAGLGVELRTPQAFAPGGAR